MSVGLEKTTYDGRTFRVQIPMLPNKHIKSYQSYVEDRQPGSKG